MIHSESLKEIAPALAKAQAAVKNPVADATNPYFNSKYADLATSLDAIRGPFGENGLSIVQNPLTSERFAPGAAAGDRPHLYLRVETTVLHASGEWMRFDGPEIEVVRRKGKRGQSQEEEQVIAGPPNAQDVSAINTYLRRIGVNAAAGIAQTDEDDDGNEASGRTETNGNSRAPTPPPRAQPPAPRDLGTDAAIGQVYAAIMVMLNEVVTIGEERVPVLESAERSTWKKKADEAKADAAALRGVYDALKSAAVAAKGRKGI